MVAATVVGVVLAGPVAVVVPGPAAGPLEVGEVVVGDAVWLVVAEPTPHAPVANTVVNRRR
jgi:hypothetical protein